MSTAAVGFEPAAFVASELEGFGVESGASTLHGCAPVHRQDPLVETPAACAQVALVLRGVQPQQSSFPPGVRFTEPDSQVSPNVQGLRVLVETEEHREPLLLHYSGHELMRALVRDIRVLAVREQDDVGTDSQEERSYRREVVYVRQRMGFGVFREPQELEARGVEPEKLAAGALFCLSNLSFRVRRAGPGESIFDARA